MNLTRSISLTVIAALLPLLGAGCGAQTGAPSPAPQAGPLPIVEFNRDGTRKGISTVDKIKKTPDQWRQELDPEQFHVCREKGTERPFTGTYWNNHEDGIYRCVACGTPLFSAKTKFESGTGWPSFYEPIAPENVATRTDATLGMSRTEALCPRCDAHLGHVFEDGPKPTGLRYCINSAALNFEKKKTD